MWQKFKTKPAYAFSLSITVKEEILPERIRDRLDLTQREMAERLEMSESSYSDIETGVYMCGTHNIIS